MAAHLEDDDFQLVHDRIFAPYGLIAERIDGEEVRKKSAPDFRLFKDGEIVAYCEVKSPRDSMLDRLSEALSSALPGEIVSIGGNDPTFNKLSRHLKKACYQLTSVNPQRVELNIVVFVNRIRGVSFLDLHETVLGYIKLGDGSLLQTMPKRAQALRPYVATLDLIGWIDANGQEGPLWAITEHEERKHRVTQLFGVNLPSA